MKVQVKPWTNQSGRPIDDTDLQIQSRKWTPEIWESYLQTLEGQHSGQYFKSKAYDGYCSELVESIFSVVTNESDPITKSKIEIALATLPKKQASVLRQIFWEGKSQRKIAKDWSIQQSSVFDLKQRALRG